MVPRHAHDDQRPRQSVSAVELGRRLGVSDPTAWYLHKRLRHAMRQDDSGLRLGGPDHDGGPVVVEADNITLGGECRQGRGTAGKTQAIVACERHACGRMGQLAMQVVEGFSTASVQAFRDARIAPDARVHTDGLAAFNAFGEAGRTHQRTLTGGRRPARQRGAAFFVVNTAIANLSTALKATHKAISPKHTQDYLAAFCWTTNRRRSMSTMITSLCRAAATASSLTRKSVYAQQGVSTG